MDAILLWLTANFGKFGVLLVILVAIVVKYDKYLLTKLRKYFGKGMLPKDILKAKLSYWLNFKIPNMHMQDKARKLIFRDLLTIRFKSLENSVGMLETKSGFSKLSGQELYKNFLDCMAQTNQTFKKEVEIAGIPEIVRIKYEEWTARTMEYLLISGQMVLQSNIYDSNEEKVQALYMLITSLLEITIAEAEYTLDTLNGELTGLEYRGQICE